MDSEMEDVSLLSTSKRRIREERDREFRKLLSRMQADRRRRRRESRSIGRHDYDFIDLGKTREQTKVSDRQEGKEAELKEVFESQTLCHNIIDANNLTDITAKFDHITISALSEEADSDSEAGDVGFLGMSKDDDQDIEDIFGELQAIQDSRRLERGR